MVIRFPSTARINVVNTRFQLLDIIMASRNGIVAVDSRSIFIGTSINTITIRGVVPFIVVDSTITMGLKIIIIRNV